MSTESTRIKEHVTVGVHDKPGAGSRGSRERVILAEARRRIEERSRPLRDQMARHVVNPLESVTALGAFDTAIAIIMDMEDEMQ
jgi:hypothetical protein